MQDDIGPDVTTTLRRLGLTEAQVQSHVMRPEHIAVAALGIELRDAVDGDDDVFEPPSSGLFYRLNVEKLGTDLHALLSPCVVGYSLELRQYGRTLLSRPWGKSRTPGDGDVPWATGVPMHVASVSKLITAMALTKLLRDRGLSPDSGIARWLPASWQRGPGVDRITFRHLLTHRSGLGLGPDAGEGNYEFMKDRIAIGTSNLGTPDYKNVNFTLCRILIANILDRVSFELPGTTDKFRDLASIRAYERYVAETVFAPVGVTSGFDHTDPNALAYPFPADEPGWSSGDISSMSGAAGWHMSVDDLLRVMAAFRRRNLIVAPAVAEIMLERQFGLDLKRDTPLGRIYGKGGFWSRDGDGRFVEQSNVFFLPKGMELVVLANSPFCAPKTGFTEQVLAAIVANIESTLVRTVATLGAAFGILAAFRASRSAGPRP